MTTSAFDRQMDVADALIVLYNATNNGTVQRKALYCLNEYILQVEKERNTLRITVAFLRAEVERLRAALTEVIEAEEWPFSDAPPWGCALVRCYLALGREPGEDAPDELRAAYQTEKAAQEGGE